MGCFIELLIIFSPGFYIYIYICGQVYKNVFSVLVRLPANSERCYLDLAFFKERDTPQHQRTCILCLKGPARALKNLYKH